MYYKNLVKYPKLIISCDINLIIKLLKLLNYMKLFTMIDYYNIINK